MGRGKCGAKKIAARHSLNHATLVFDVKRIYQESLKQKLVRLGFCVFIGGRICVPRQLPLARLLHDMNFIALSTRNRSDDRHKSALASKKKKRKKFQSTFRFSSQFLHVRAILRRKIKNHLYSDGSPRQ